MFAGVPSTIPSQASRSDAVAASAARDVTSTPVISGSFAPRCTSASSSAVAGDGVWCTISRRAIEVHPALRDRVAVLAVPVRERPWTAASAPDG